MVLTVSTNITALASLRQLRQGSANLNESVNRLSTGNRINSARDDASGLAISSGLRVDLATSRAAQNNISQATSMLQITDSGFEAMQGKIARMTELAAISRSDTLTDQERLALDIEFQLLNEGITQTTLSTTFNGQNLMGQRPEFVVDNIGADVSTEDGFIGFRFENDNPQIMDGDVYEIHYDAGSQTMMLVNTRTTYRQSINLSGITPIPAGNVETLNFDQLGVRIQISSEFDFATDLDPDFSLVNFTARIPVAAPPSFAPTDLPALIANISGEDSTINNTPLRGAIH